MKFPGEWMELKKIILGEVSQIYKDECAIHSLLCGYEFQK